MTSDLIGKLVADKYRIESLILESDSGDLFRAVHESRATPLILELLPRAFSVDGRWAKKFLDRARIAGGISHPNALRLEDYGEDSRGNVYAVYENVNAELLDSLITRPLPQIQAIGIARDIAQALEAAHERGVLHGALSPKKVLVESGSDAKVYGFGGERFDIPGDKDSEYLAPEQSNAYPIADTRSDTYALGKILKRMLAGPATVDGAADALPENIHPELTPIIETATAPDPELRYPSATAFREDLDRIYAESGGNAILPKASKKHNIWQTAFIALCGIVVLAGVFIYATYSRGSDPTVTMKVDEGSLPVQPINPATGAQEEALLKSAPIGDPSSLQDPYLNGATPGGDGYNAWANGVMPPAGAPLSGTTTGPLAGSQFPQNPQNPQNGIPPQAIGPPGERVTVQPGGSVFMPNEGGVILVPVPKTQEPEPTNTPKNNAANTAVKNPPGTATPPKTTATPAKTTEKPAASATESKKVPAKSAKKGKTEE
ncbi:MAG TPA: protein kinase [Pyrinomonadaceae bacterium]|nr:protein kinase [Pyrinomonadaceae bacterium]